MIRKTQRHPDVHRGAKTPGFNRSMLDSNCYDVKHESDLGLVTVGGATQ
ncbi:MAG: hypothetical protein JW860_07210 [Sedimentisphaerales bacterium]|nr:hypothetical protein [Sedimentisphaerales bacterium]